MKTHIVYSKQELNRLIAKNTEQTIIADEMINVGYKRDFWDADQKTLIKMLNMYRDRRNILIMCVPNFNSIDKDILDLVKLHINIVRRGVGVLHAQVPNIYSNDKWDVYNNKKIEQSWTKNGVYKPQYSKLTTFRGFVRFKKLPPSWEKRYQSIKDSKRAQFGIEEIDDDSSIGSKPDAVFYDRIISQAKKGLISKDVLNVIAITSGISVSSLTQRINNRLKKINDPYTLNVFIKEAEKKKLPDVIIKNELGYAIEKRKALPTEIPYPSQ